jgi:hypothetical protein
VAKVVYSPQVGDMRNKTGGAVHTKTRFGSMVRRKVSPVQPRSTAQMNVRAGFTSLSKLWSESSMDSNRAGWIGLADSYPVKDVFGQSQKLTGHQMFVRCNRALQTLGITSPILTPPSTLSVPYPGALTLAHDGPPVTSLSLNVATPPTAAEDSVIFATPGISPGRAGAGARFRVIGTFTSATPLPYNFRDSYVWYLGAPITGRKIFIRVVYTKKATGAQSLPSEASITI